MMSQILQGKIACVAGATRALILTILVRKRPEEFALSLVAFLCIVGTQVVFWAFTFPGNQQTSNWTVLPENWETLRMRWEYSHAASAVLNLVAFIALAFSISRHK